MALKLARQVEELQENGEPVEQGWALKLRAKHDPIPAEVRVIFCIYFFPFQVPSSNLIFKAKQALRQIFALGNQTGKKYTPEAGAKMLRQRFQTDERMWLKPSQVNT